MRGLLLLDVFFANKFYYAIVVIVNVEGEYVLPVDQSVLNCKAYLVIIQLQWVLALHISAVH